MLFKTKIRNNSEYLIKTFTLLCYILSRLRRNQQVGLRLLVRKKSGRV
jgi:hypothetical protein